jgi:hypothetical protein
MSFNIYRTKTLRKKFLYLIPRGGLSNRTRAIASALFACEQHGFSLVMKWRLDEHMGATYEELFSTKISQDLSSIDGLSKSCFYMGTQFSPDSFSDDGVRVLEIITDNRFTFESGMDVFSPEFNQLLHKYLNYLTPVEHIREKAQKIWQTFDQHTVGVHIRSGLGEAGFNEKSDISLKQFSQRMNALTAQDPRINYYVASDSVTAFAYIEQNSDKPIKCLDDCTEHNPPIRQDDSESVQTALVEILALARTNSIMGSYYSSYSEYASLLGKIELETLRKMTPIKTTTKKQNQLWGLVTLFNPCGYSGLSNNLTKFLESARSQGLNIMLLEIAFGDLPFVGNELLVDRVVQFRSNSVLWHKERLFNLALDHLPDSCEAVCWLDGDILFQNSAWVNDTLNALQNHKVVQPFEFCTWLPPMTDNITEDTVNYPVVNGEGGQHHSFGYGWNKFGKAGLKAQIFYGHVGFAWAIRRDVIQEIGFYDGCIVGSNDVLMAQAFVGNYEFLKQQSHRYNASFLQHYHKWSRKALDAVGGDVSFIEGNVLHLWHGQSSSRSYTERLEITKNLNVDPSTDLLIGENGLYELPESSGALAEQLNNYFSNRKEDYIPKELVTFRYKSGFHDDEGSFRWAEAESSIEIQGSEPSVELLFKNNVLRKLNRSQTVTAYKDNQVIGHADMNQSEEATLPLTNLRLGDIITLKSDFEFSPCEHGGTDYRRLAFMLVYN